MLKDILHDWPLILAAIVLWLTIWLPVTFLIYR